MKAERPLPASVEAEKLILGSLLSGDLLYGQASQVIQGADFSIEAHRRIFDRMGELQTRGEAINRVAVYHELERHGQHDGALAYLADLEREHIGANLDGYLARVRETATRRRAITLLHVATEETWGGSDGLRDILDRTTQNLQTLARESRPGRGSSIREFTAVGDGRYRLSLADLAISFDVDRLRREHHELVGELCVRCDLPGTRSVNGTLTIADFNLSSARARSERAKLLTERANTPDLDWHGLVEEFCQRVLEADRSGQPALDLRDLPRPDSQTDDIRVEGFVLPRRHPSIIFGDGASAKSYTALYLAARMAEQGMVVALFDWELAGDDHRERLERLFGPDMPRILYARCEKPLVFEADRLRRIVREGSVNYVIYDSVAFACDGPPEAAEVAGRYFQAVRQVGCGSLHIAHISKGEGADKKPFGSAFWHNTPRATWYAKLAEGPAESDILNVGFFNRKHNLRHLSSPVGFTIIFSGDRTTFRRADVADTPDLAGQLSIRQRMAYLLRKGAMTPEAIADEIEADLETVKRTARRYRKLFTLLEGGRVGLLERTGS
jgi:hypothetical protein